jgi:hypothetical protein
MAPMGERLWSRSTRTTLGPLVMAWLALIGGYFAFRSQYAWTRSALVAIALLFAAGAVDAWRAEVVVGTEGIAVRRTYSRMRLPWAAIADFAATPRGGRGGVEVRLAGGGSRSLLDWPIDSSKALDLVVELKGELDRHHQ